MNDPIKRFMVTRCWKASYMTPILDLLVKDPTAEINLFFEEADFDKRVIWQMGMAAGITMFDLYKPNSTTPDDIHIDQLVKALCKQCNDDFYSWGSLGVSLEVAVLNAYKFTRF